MVALNLSGQETVLDTLAVLPVIHKGQAIGERRPSLEQCILNAESLPHMETTEGVLRGSVFHYMHVHHAVAVEGGYNIHHRQGCAEPSHSSLYSVWSVKRAARVAEEAALREKIRKTEKAALKKKRKPTISGRAIARIAQKYGTDPRAIHDTHRHYKVHPASSISPEPLYRLLYGYWQSSDRNDHRRWHDLAAASGLEHASTAAAIIKGLGLPSLTRSVAFTRRVRVTPEEHMLMNAIHSTPFTVTELRYFLNWPRGYVTIEPLLTKIGPRPWARKWPAKHTGRRAVSDYISASRLYMAMDEGIAVADAALHTGLKISTAVSYENARAVVECQLNELLKIKEATLGSNSLSDIVKS